VLNTAADSEGLIRHGNERVLRARFNDARFFWQTDQKQTLASASICCGSVTFQKDLGSYYDKTMRVQHLASSLAETETDGMAIRPGVIHKAALLAKTDLTTELVKEFTELQELSGALRASAGTRRSIKPDVQLAVSRAIYDHYKPESMEDGAPTTIEVQFSRSPTRRIRSRECSRWGSFPAGREGSISALRRQTNGIVKTIAEHKLPLRLSEIMADARSRYKDSEARRSSRTPATPKRCTVFSRTAGVLPEGCA